MNLLKSFSVTTGLEPKKGFIYEKFYPFDFDKYIVLDSQTSNPLLHYAFWFRVIELIEPILSEQNIKIVHFIEDKKYQYKHIYLGNDISLNEKAYILKRAKLFCGSSKIYSLICSEFNVKQCFIKTDYFLDNTLAPESEIIHTDKKRRNFVNPSLAQINNIRPEEIAKKILKSILNKDFTFDNTISIGKLYNAFSIELIPDSNFQINNNNKNEILIRMDQAFSEPLLEAQLNLEKASIVTNKAINKQLLEKCARNINKVYFKIEKNSNADFVGVLENLRINYDLISSLNDDDLNREKIKYIDYKKINKLTSVDLGFLQDLDMSKVYFKTNRIIVKGGKTYPSKWYSKMDKPHGQIRNGNFPIPDVNYDELKEEAEHFYILTSEQL